jgi:hypothetical protein
VAARSPPCLSATSRRAMFDRHEYADWRAVRSHRRGGGCPLTVTNMPTGVLCEVIGAARAADKEELAPSYAKGSENAQLPSGLQNGYFDGRFARACRACVGQRFAVHVLRRRAQPELRERAVAQRFDLRRVLQLGLGERAATQRPAERILRRPLHQSMQSVQVPSGLHNLSLTTSSTRAERTCSCPAV